MPALRTGAVRLPVAAGALVGGRLLVLAGVLGRLEVLIVVLNVNLISHPVDEVVIQVV